MQSPTRARKRSRCHLAARGRRRRAATRRIITPVATRKDPKLWKRYESGSDRWSSTTPTTTPKATCFYLHGRAPQEAEGEETPEGHILRFEPGTHRIVGLTVINARWLRPGRTPDRHDPGDGRGQRRRTRPRARRRLSAQLPGAANRAHACMEKRHSGRWRAALLLLVHCKRLGVTSETAPYRAMEDRCRGRARSPARALGMSIDLRRAAACRSRPRPLPASNRRD
jgi:hypothetical protein